MNNLIELAKEYRTQREVTRAASRKHDTEKKTLKQLETQLAGAMLEAGQKFFRMEDGTGVRRRLFRAFSPEKGEPWGKIIQWLRDTGNGSMIKESIRDFTEFCRGHEDEGREFPDFVRKFEEDRITMTTG